MVFALETTSLKDFTASGPQSRPIQEAGIPSSTVANPVWQKQYTVLYIIRYINNLHQILNVCNLQIIFSSFLSNKFRCQNCITSATGVITYSMKTLNQLHSFDLLNNLSGLSSPLFRHQTFQLIDIIFLSTLPCSRELPNGRKTSKLPYCNIISWPKVFT